MKPQKKFQTEYDKDHLGVPAKKQVERIDQLKGDPLDYPIVLHTPEKGPKKVHFFDLPDETGFGSLGMQLLRWQGRDGQATWEPKRYTSKRRNLRTKSKVGSMT